MYVLKALKDVEKKIGGVLRLEFFSDGSGSLYRYTLEEDEEQLIGFFHSQKTLDEMLKAYKKIQKDDM